MLARDTEAPICGPSEGPEEVSTEAMDWQGAPMPTKSAGRRGEIPEEGQLMSPKACLGSFRKKKPVFREEQALKGAEREW
jgi:hypothetical protein